MPVESASLAAAYASKRNIAYPGSSAEAATVATAAAARTTDQVNSGLDASVPGAQAVRTDRDAGASEGRKNHVIR